MPADLPSNASSEEVLHYMGRFKVKFGVQVRQLRKNHPDSHYVCAFLEYARNFSLQYRSRMMLCQLMISVSSSLVSLLVLYLLEFMVTTAVMFLFMDYNYKCRTMTSIYMVLYLH